MIHEKVHEAINAKREQVSNWFAERCQGSLPFYSSFDVRDSGWKVAPVDANLYPAGFNNLCEADLASATELAKKYLDSSAYAKVKNVVLLTEEHTNNPFYWDNVKAIEDILEKTGREVRITIPRELTRPVEMTSHLGHKLTLFPSEKAEGRLTVDGLTADLIISNNDFSETLDDWMRDLKTPINPPYELGWHNRRKDRFFTIYNQNALSFCEVLGLDPWPLLIETEVFKEFDPSGDESREALAAIVDQRIENLKKEYLRRNIDSKPFLFVKNNAGTYGLGVTKVESGEEIRNWNSKLRKKMKAAKGGRDVDEVIIQEGVPTVVRAKGKTAEPVIYMIGRQVAGGFLRTHEEKGPDESLNSPGAIYQRLCVSDLTIHREGGPTENVYNWIARLSVLALAIEARQQNLKF